MTKPSYEELARKSDAMADILAHALRCGYLPAMTAHEAETILNGGDVGQQSALFQSLTQSLARVRGLLQRQSEVFAEILAKHEDFESTNVNREWWHKCYCGDTFSTRDILDPLLDRDFRTHVATALANFPQSSDLVSQGAESADIGKLDTADKSGKVNRVDEKAETVTKYVCGSCNGQGCGRCFYGKVYVGKDNNAVTSAQLIAAGEASPGFCKKCRCCNAVMMSRDCVCECHVTKTRNLSASTEPEKCLQADSRGRRCAKPAGHDRFCDFLIPPEVDRVCEGCVSDGEEPHDQSICDKVSQTGNSGRSENFPLARSIVEQVARDAVKVLLMRHSSDIDIHDDAPTVAELEQDVVNVLLGDDLGCLDPEDVSDENCTVLAVEKMLAGSAETGGEKA